MKFVTASLYVAWPWGKYVTRPEQVISEISPLQDVLINGAFENGRIGDPNIVAYRAAPAVVVYQEGLIPGAAEPTAFERVDVIANSSRVFSIENGQLLADPAKQILPFLKILFT